jgi:hypothetical protein
VFVVCLSMELILVAGLPDVPPLLLRGAVDCCAMLCARTTDSSSTRLDLAARVTRMIWSFAARRRRLATTSVEYKESSEQPIHCVGVGRTDTPPWGQDSTSFTQTQNSHLSNRPERNTNMNLTGHAPESVSTSVSSSPCNRSKDGRWPELRSYLVRR